MCVCRFRAEMSFLLTQLLELMRANREVFDPGNYPSAEMVYSATQIQNIFRQHRVRNRFSARVFCSSLMSEKHAQKKRRPTFPLSMLL